MSPGDSLQPVARRFWSFVKPHSGGFLLAVMFFLLASATEPLVPALLAAVLDKGFAETSSFPIWVVPVAMIGLFFLRGSLSFCASYLLTRAGAATVFDLRRALMASLLKADAHLFSHTNPGRAVMVVVNNPQDITGSISGALTTVLRDGSTALFMLGYLLYLNWKLTVLSLIIVPGLAYSVRAVHRRVKAMGEKAYEFQMGLVSVVDDVTRAWRVVRTFDAAEWEKNRFDNVARQLQRATLKSVSAGALMSPVSQLVASVGVAIVLTLALVQARQGTATIGEFVGFITAMLLLVSKIRHLTDIAQPVIGGLTVARGCFELLDTPAEKDTGTRSLERGAGLVEFDKVKVYYPGSERPALNGVSFSIQPGQTMAIVGSSGAGKTTVVNALLGFVEPTEGEIRLDGIDITELRKASLRKQLAVVSQDIVLFDDSIAANVVYSSELDLFKVEQCLKAAHLWSFVQATPEGLDTRIGTNGSRLSGGQRQRLAIARALYKDAPIWVFDEATSALDTESERAVQQAIDEWHGQKTLVLIAHRLSTVRNADRILVMSEGGIVESGTHEELMARDGAYASMVRAQNTA